MTCYGFESILTDLARDEGLTPALREEALSHCRACERCAGCLEKQRDLLSSLKELAALDMAQVPSLRVEAALAEAFHQNVTPRVWRRWAFTAAAAAVGAVVLTALIGTQPEEPIARRTPAAATDVRGQEIVTEFLPLDPMDTLAGLDGSRLVRVRLPRSAMATFGLPVNEERAFERIQADVLLGYDGAARAVRFVW
ncbi:MAG: hypothetical protein WD696_10925 [Bryobacteraceae bacterium]